MTAALLPAFTEASLRFGEYCSKNGALSIGKGLLPLPDAPEAAVTACVSPNAALVLAGGEIPAVRKLALRFYELPNYPS